MIFKQSIFIYLENILIKHPNYNSFTNLNDIAILKLSQRVTFNRYIQPACLPTAKSFTFPPANENSWAVGWGTNYSLKIT